MNMHKYRKLIFDQIIENEQMSSISTDGTRTSRCSLKRTTIILCTIYKMNWDCKNPTTYQEIQGTFLSPWLSQRLLHTEREASLMNDRFLIWTLLYYIFPTFPKNVRRMAESG